MDSGTNIGQLSRRALLQLRLWNSHPRRWRHNCCLGSFTFPWNKPQDYPPTLETISDFNQIGLAIVTPNRIPHLWEKYTRKQVSLQQVREAIESDDEDGEI